MEARPIRLEEYIEAAKIQTVAFAFSQDFSKTETDPDKLQKMVENYRAFFDDSGKMCSCLELLPYEVQFHGHVVKMGGIGGVASLPERRGNGNIRRLFRSIMEEMRDKDQILSFLYPFSHSYYRKFGYEMCYTQTKVTVNLSDFSHFPRTGSVSLHQPGFDRKDFYELYNQFIQDKNLAIARNDRQWDKLLGSDPYKSSQFAYLWYSEKGKPGAYLVFHADNKNGEKNIGVKEWIWSDRDSLLGILGFVNQLSAQYKKLVWNSPGYPRFPLLIPDPYPVEQEIRSSGCCRIVDLVKVLEKICYPIGKGRMVLDVRDDFLEWNSGVYQVEWEKNRENDKDCVSIIKTTKTADLSCSIQTLTQLCTGFISMEEAVLCGDAEIHNNQAVLASVFLAGKVFINDYF